MDKKVSIVVPIYKVQNYLRACLDSLVEQSYRNIEIILVDDGSPDSCPQICDEYRKKDARVTVIHKQNGGLVSARKAGAIVATGDYIACVDGDDWVSHLYIETLVNAAVSTCAQIICCGYYIVKHNRELARQMPERKGYYNKMDLENEIYPHLIQASNATSFSPTVWAKLIERGVYIEHQLTVPNSISMGEDGACTIPIVLNVDSMYIIDECLYYYRESQSSMTHIKKAVPWDNYYSVTKHLTDIISASSRDMQQQLDRRIAHSFFTVAKSQFNQNIPFGTIKREILDKMSDPITKKAIENCMFSYTLKAQLIQFTLKTKSVVLLALLNRFF